MNEQTATKYILSMPFDTKFVPVINELATQIGLYESLVLQQISIWMKSSTHIHEGKYWIYKTAKEMQEESFSYLSEETVRRTLQSLETMGYILVGNFNKVGFDRTKWYAIEPDKCSSLLGVFVNDIPSDPAPIPQIGEWKDLRENPSPIPQIGGTIPESLIQEVGVPTSVAPTATTATSSSSEDAKQIDLFAAIPIVEPMPNVHKPAKVIAAAAEPNLTTPYRAIVAKETGGEEVKEDEKAGRTKGGRKRKEGVTPAECINPMKAAIMKAFNWSWNNISKSEKGQVYEAAKQLCDCNFPLDKIPDLHTYCQSKFKIFGPVALTTNQSEFRKTITPTYYTDEAKLYAEVMREMVFGS